MDDRTMSQQKRPAGFEWCQFSKNWTPEDKLKLVALLAQIIQDDIPAGRYSEIGRPNCQSIMEVIIATPAEMEEMRGTIDQMIEMHARELAARTVVHAGGGGVPS